MSRVWTLGLALVALLGGVLVGRASRPEPAVPPPAATVDALATLQSAHDAPGAAPIRTAALAGLEAAESEADIVEALRSLTPVATPDDLELAAGLAWQTSDGIATEALRLLARLDTPASLERMLEAGEGTHSTEAYAMLGWSRQPRALEALLGRTGPQSDGVPYGLAWNGSEPAIDALLRRPRGIAGPLRTVAGREPRARTALITRASAPLDPRATDYRDALVELRDPAALPLVAAAYAAQSKVRVPDTPEGVAFLESVLATSQKRRALKHLWWLRCPEADEVVLDVLRAGDAEEVKALLEGPARDDPARLEALLEVVGTRSASITSSARDHLFAHHAHRDAVRELARERFAEGGLMEPRTVAALLAGGAEADHRQVWAALDGAPPGTWIPLLEGDAPHPDLVLRALEHPAAPVRDLALQHLRNLPEHVPDALDRLVEILRREKSASVVWALGPFPQPAVLDALEDLLVDDERSQMTATAVVAVLAKTPAGRTRLRRRLSSLPSRRRSLVFGILLQWEPDVTLVEQAIDENDPLLGSAITAAILRMGREAREPLLLSLLEDPIYTSAALRQAAYLRDPTSVDRIVELTADPRFASPAAHALAMVDHPAGLEALHAIAEEGTPPQRRAALQWLGLIGDTRATPILRAAAGDPDEEIAATAAKALEEIGE